MAGTTKYYTRENLNEYARKFDLAVVKPEFKLVAERFVARLVSNITIYISIQNATGVPFYFVAALHMRESGMDFTRHLHNGNPLTRRTTDIPKDRPAAAPRNGKYYTFTESAIDAMKYMQLDKWKDWSISGMMYIFETYNGMGYMARGRVSPYLWSGTQFYVSGKYKSDKSYSSTAVDKQLGAAAFLKLYLSNYDIATGKKKAFEPSVSHRGNSFLDFFKHFIFGHF